MYIVTLHNPGIVPIEIHGNIEKLQSGKVVKGINTIDSFTFAMLPSNVGFALIKDFKTLVKVFNTNTNKTEFVGRSLYTTTEMAEDGMITKEVVCESVFGYLCDSIQTYVEEMHFGGGAEDLLTTVINCHNSLVESEKQFALRNIAKTSGINCGIQRENTWDTIKKKLLDTEGGELAYEVVGDTIYLDYMEQMGEVKTTEIALSRNMKSITRERNPSEYITRLIPLGAKKEDSEQRLDISSVNGGEIYIDDEAGIKEYGIHVGIQEWDDVTDPTNLLNKGRTWMSNNSKIPVRYSITALDLALLGLDIDHFEVGNSHQLVNSLIGVDEEAARIIKKTIDVCEEVNSTIEIGDKFKTLTEIQQDQKRETVAAVKVIQKVSGDYVSRTDNNQVARMVSNSTEKVVIKDNRLELESDTCGVKDGILTAKDAILSGKFEATGQREYLGNPVEVSVVIEDGEMFTQGISTQSTLSGAQFIGAGTDYRFKDIGELNVLLVPWLLQFGCNGNTIGGIRTTSDSIGNPNTVDNVIKMYGDWKVTGNMTLASGEAVTSDKNRKNTITDLSEKYSAFFAKLKPRLFKYNDGTSDRLHVGFIAQEVKEAMDAAELDAKDFAALCIKQSPDGSEEWSLRYSEFIAMNTMEIQKLKARMEELEKLLKSNTVERI